MDDTNQAAVTNVGVVNQTPADPATVTVEVPAEHADLLQRAVELLKSGEQWVKDNIEAGVTTLEGLYKSDVTPE